MAEYPPYCIVISIYGENSLTHDQITRTQGSFEKTLTNIKKLKKADLSIRLSAIVFKENFAEAKRIKALAKKLDVSVIFYPHLIPALNKNASPLAYCVGDSECAQISVLNQAKKKPMPKKGHVFPCNAGSQSFHIDCSGNLYLCKIERSTSYSLTNNSFSSAWKKLGKIRLEKLRLPEDCLSCDQKANCRTCPPLKRL